jgi:sugar phosphate isomerase/epimerase
MTGAALPLASASGLLAQRKAVPVGIELYSVRTELSRDLAGTVMRVAKMGYSVVEFYAPYFSWTTTQAKDVRKLLDDLGIACHSTHNSAEYFSADSLPKAIELNQIIGSKYVIQASANAKTLDDWKRLAEQLTTVADRLRPLGMATGYHNHQTEWQPVEGQRPMDVIAGGTPKDVVLQFDVGTCVEVGADPIAWVNANRDRIRSVHCKDWGAGEGRGYGVAFGEGDVPWLKIFAALEASAGLEYYLIEQELSPQGQQFTMAEKCLANWKKLRAGT